MGMYWSAEDKRISQYRKAMKQYNSEDINFIVLDDQLEEIFHMRPIIRDCLLYRTSIGEYRHMMKQAMTTEMKNLFNVEMVIDQIELKFPKIEQLPPILEVPIVGTQVQYTCNINKDFPYLS